jgi:hypothetical protein
MKYTIIILAACLFVGCATFQPRSPQVGDKVTFQDWTGCANKGTIITIGSKYTIAYTNMDGWPDTTTVRRTAIIKP